MLFSSEAGALNPLRVSSMPLTMLRRDEVKGSGASGFFIKDQWYSI